jgi:hypothetical protein
MFPKLNFIVNILIQSIIPRRLHTGLRHQKAYYHKWNVEKQYDTVTNKHAFRKVFIFNEVCNSVLQRVKPVKQKKK